MRSLLPLGLAAVVALGALAPAAAASEARAAIVVSAVFAPRTALRLSTELLRFNVTTSGEPATATMDFSAAIRTRADAEVVLSIEALPSMDGSDEPPAGSLTFVGEGEGTTAGTMGPDTLAVAGRWIGSGRRMGRLTFSLRTAATGTHTVPVRFVLSTP